LKWTFADDGNPRRRAQWGAFVFCAVLALALPQAALLPLLDRDEPRFAEASREMLQTGNFVVPMFNGEPRYAKPPLIYWAQAASFRVFGENAFAARLPSLLATAGTALVLYAWGLELGGLTAGLIAALGYALCLQTMQQGRVATADALMIFFVALSGWAGWKMFTLARGRSYWKAETPPLPWDLWGGGLALALAGGFLAKGPEALLPVLAMICCSMGGGPKLALRFIAILLLGLLIVSAWAIPAYIQTHGDYWRVGLGHDVGDRMVSGFEGHGAGSFGWYLLFLPLYFVLFWISALPWSPLLVTRRRQLFPRPLSSIDDAYLLMNAGLFFVVFTFMVTKLPHYTLPAFPFLALLLGKAWSDAGLAPDRPVRLMMKFGIWFALIALVVIPGLMMPLANPSPVGMLVRDAGSSLTPDTPFALVDYDEPNVIWEMRRVARGYGQVIPAPAVLAFLREPGPRAVILTQGLWRDGVKPPTLDPGWHVYSEPGFNAARLKLITLVLVVKR
jgi:4-amino-4-deoxy-L-arabinose transferase-like glycosyltransferase